ncbi:MAG: hypothetical protein NZT92_03050 [Abditibacteriales bacterium]|nr:hypothetical protein [Abditibacteriales bacterium]
MNGIDDDGDGAVDEDLEDYQPLREASAGWRGQHQFIWRWARTIRRSDGTYVTHNRPLPEGLRSPERRRVPTLVDAWAEAP